LIFVSGLCIGMWRGDVVRHTMMVYQHIVGKTVMLDGSVAEDPDTDKSGSMTVRLHDVLINGHTLPGEVWVGVVGKKPIERSDRVVVKGKLLAGFASFGASMYRADVVKIQRPVPGDVALHVRNNFADHVRQGIREPAASLGLGYLVGQRRALPPKLDDALRIAGLMHVVVASGYNLTILVRLGRRLFARVSKFLAAFSSSALIVGFYAVTGASPSMARAGLVAFLSLAAWYYGRRFHPLVLLPLAAAVTLLVDPSYGWNNLGWSLSFAAFAGVMILAPLGQAYFFGSKKPSTVRQILGETITAQIATLPLLVSSFGVFSTVAIFANLLILPLVPLAMLLTFITGIAGYILPDLVHIIAFPAQILLDYMVWVAEYFANLPWSQIETAWNGWIVALYYVVLLGVAFWIWRATKLSLRDSNIVE
ncbi:MAG TPA: ComEC/Rec2 family competence protein, partial [Candidatus Saccharimonadaceae bacterium]|nr:ComEC/Rec2 family competence protein [Candidatus Saccharimonadaceae bacterium]